MSAAEILKAAKALSLEEKMELYWQLLDDIEEQGCDADLTPDDIAELDRRAEESLKHPGRGTPIDEVSARIRERIAAKK
jgi:putative addiction module component (TIGR02574 family)